MCLGGGGCYLGETILAEDKDWLEGLGAEQLRFEQVDWASVNLDQAVACLAESNCGGSFLCEQTKKESVRIVVKFGKQTASKTNAYHQVRTTTGMITMVSICI